MQVGQVYHVTLVSFPHIVRREASTWLDCSFSLFQCKLTQRRSSNRSNKVELAAVVKGRKEGRREGVLVTERESQAPTVTGHSR